LNTLYILANFDRMKICFITGDDVFYILHFFESFLPMAAKSDKIEVAGITLLPTFKKQSRYQTFKEIMSFYGPYHFVRVGFQFVYRKLTKRTLAHLAAERNIPLLETQSINDAAYIQKIKSAEIDCLVSISASQIFKKELINSVPKGCINSHSSILPDNKGMMPVFWSMFHPDSEIGVTIHYINEKIDEGKIIAQKTIEHQGEPLHEMILKTKRLSAEMMRETLEQLSERDLPGTDMPSGGRYQRFPSPQEIKAFKKSGKRIF
jgi:methionyl-tRNA formyltransferase